MSIIAPVYNEEEVISEFIKQIEKNVLEKRKNSELVLVNDGSSDNSEKIIFTAMNLNEKIKYVKLTRNFGHQNAVMAGLSVVKGDLICIIDADLQDHPSHILKMEELLDAETFIVYARRIKRLGETFFKRISSHIFYRLINYLSDTEIPKDTGDFRIVKREVVDVILSMREASPFLRGLFAFTGYRSKEYLYVRDTRYAGITKYSMRKMLKLTTAAILNFSDKPLRIILRASIASLLVSVISAIYVLILWVRGSTVPGWASVFLLVTFFGSLNLIINSIIGKYILTIWQISQRRPLFIVEITKGFTKYKK
jgi:dolichol-phosphate mannosyltransferase